MAENAFVKIGTALLKHQVKKLVGEETLGVISEELADIGGDKLDAWLGDKSTIEELKKAAQTAQDCFHDTVGDHELEQWMVSLPIGNLPKVTEALAKLPTSSDEQELESALSSAIADWRKLSPEQTEKAVNSFLSCLRSALLPIEKQTLMVVGRSVLRIEEKINQLTKLVEQLKPYSPTAPSESRFIAEINVGRDVLNSVIVEGSNNVINYFAAVEKNIEKHEPDYWALKHPYPMPPNFTGRIAERATLTHWLKEDSENRLFILRALGGFGKSALSWQWLTYDVDIKEYPKVVFWSFYEGDASFEHFIEETLKYLKLEVPQGQRPQVDALLKAMQGQKILLIMDGFERALRAYNSMSAAYQGDDPKAEENELDCVNINAEIFLKSVCSLPNIIGKVLMTTRLTPRAVKIRGEFTLGCREEELTSMQPADAVEFFHKQKIKGTRPEIEDSCAAYGYHPLSLCLLTGLILNDFENPSEISVAMKLDITNDIVQNKHHVLENSYNGLSIETQKLLSHIACLRSSVEYSTLKIIFDSLDNLEGKLRDLINRGLLHRDPTNRYSLHPIVHRYAYNKLSELEQKEFHLHLRNMFAGMVYDQAQGVLYAIDLFFHSTYCGAYEESLSVLKQLPLNTFSLSLEMSLIDLFTELANGQQIEASDAAWLYTEAAITSARIGKTNQAISYLKPSMEIYRRFDESKYLDNTLRLCDLQIELGRFKDAEANLNSLTQEDLDAESKAQVSNEKGKLLLGQGLYDQSKVVFAQTLSLLSHSEDKAAICQVLFDKSYLLLLEYRSYRKPKSLQELKDSVLAAYEIMKASKIYDYMIPIETYWLMGAMCSRYKQFSEAEKFLSDSLNLCRAINYVSLEFEVAIEYARLYYSQKRYNDAMRFAMEALNISRRCGYVLRGADVNLFLAQYALEQEKDKVKAKQYAEEAKKLATCDGPPYYYKVAYEEAERMLEKLGFNT